MRGRSFIPLVGLGPGRAIVSHGLGGVELPPPGFPCVTVADALLADVVLSTTQGDGRLALSDAPTAAAVDLTTASPYQADLTDEPVSGVDLSTELCKG